MTSSFLLSNTLPNRACTVADKISIIARCANLEVIGM